MRANLEPSVDLDFLDGYLFRTMREIAEQRGFSRSGFDNYYRHRLETRIGGLIEYEADLARYLLDRHAGRSVVHAGIGIGTLACALACNGVDVLGIERNPRRVRSAHRLRAAVAQTWPQAEKRYRIVRGTFPSALAGRRGWGPWRSGIEETNRDAILVFTNISYRWEKHVEAGIFGMLPEYAEVILDLRLFGIVREEERERLALFDRIAAGARKAEHRPAFSGQMHMAHFSFGAPA